MPSKKKFKSYFKKLTTPPRPKREDSNPGTPPECQWQGDNWRKNTRWNPPNWEGGTPPTTPPISQVPPSLPAPPQEPQDNLSREIQMADQDQLKEPQVFKSSATIALKTKDMNGIMLSESQGITMPGSHGTTMHEPQEVTMPESQGITMPGSHGTTMHEPQGVTMPESHNATLISTPEPVDDKSIVLSMSNSLAVQRPYMNKSPSPEWGTPRENWSQDNSESSDRDQMKHQTDTQDMTFSHASGSNPASSASPLPGDNELSSDCPVEVFLMEPDEQPEVVRILDTKTSKIEEYQPEVTQNEQVALLNKISPESVILDDGIQRVIPTATEINGINTHEENDNEIIKNDNEIIKNDNEIIKNDNEIIKNDNEIIKNDNEIIKNDNEIIKNDSPNNNEQNLHNAMKENFRTLINNNIPLKINPEDSFEELENINNDNEEMLPNHIEQIILMESSSKDKPSPSLVVDSGIESFGANGGGVNMASDDNDLSDEELPEINEFEGPDDECLVRSLEETRPQLIKEVTNNKVDLQNMDQEQDLGEEEEEEEEEEEIESHWAIWEREQREEFEKELQMREALGETQATTGDMTVKFHGKLGQNPENDAFLTQDRRNFKKPKSAPTKPQRRRRRPAPDEGLGDDDDEALPDMPGAGDDDNDNRLTESPLGDWWQDENELIDSNDQSSYCIRPSMKKMKNFWEQDRTVGKPETPPTGIVKLSFPPKRVDVAQSKTLDCKPKSEYPSLINCNIYDKVKNKNEEEEEEKEAEMDQEKSERENELNLEEGYDGEIDEDVEQLTVQDLVESHVTFPSADKKARGPPTPPPLPVVKLKAIPAPPPPPPPPSGRLLLPAMPVLPSHIISEKRKKKLEQIRKATRQRPDWHNIMSEVKGGINLRHIGFDKKTDRSRPILPASRGKNGRFVYESEKPLAHNNLIREIHRGVRLRKTKSDDRSQVDFKTLGLRKFRRQRTKEEKETIDPNTPDALPSSSDEEEDIDLMRDDIQSTKSQLAEQLKSNKKMDREVRIHKIDIDSYKAEIQKLKRQLREAGVQEPKILNTEPNELAPQLSKSFSRLKMREEESSIDASELQAFEGEVEELKSQIYAQRQRADASERREVEINQKLTLAALNSEEWEVRCNYFEKKFRQLQKDQGIELPEVNCVTTQYDAEDCKYIPEEPEISPKKSESRRSFASQFSRMESFREEEEEDDEEEEESEEESSEEEEEYDDEEQDVELNENGEEMNDEEKEAKKEAKRQERELSLWKNKLSHMKEKEINVTTDRCNLRDKIINFHKGMIVEREEYLKSKAELAEMAALLKDPNDVDEEPEEEEEEEEEEPEEKEQLPAEIEDGKGWWFDEIKLKPKKLKKRIRRYLNEYGETVEEEAIEEDDEDLADMTTLEPPEWEDSEAEVSDTDNEEEDIEDRLWKLRARTQNHEFRMGGIKKANYLLKEQSKRGNEMHQEEQRRHKRLQEELQILISDVDY